MQPSEHGVAARYIARQSHSRLVILFLTVFVVSRCQKCHTSAAQQLEMSKGVPGSLLSIST